MSHEDRIHTFFKVHLSSNSFTTVCKDNFVFTQYTMKQVFALFQKYLKQTNKSDIIMNLQIKDFSLKCSATPTAMPTQYEQQKTKSTQYSGTSIFQALIYLDKLGRNFFGINHHKFQLWSQTLHHQCQNSQRSQLSNEVVYISPLDTFVA